MEYALVTALRPVLSYSCLMPPTIFIITCLMGALIGLRRPRTGIAVVLTSACFLYVFSIPAIPNLLERQFLSIPETRVDFSDAQAIVVPCVDVRWGDGVSVPDTVGAITLERLAKAARLYRRLQLPVLVSGAGRFDRPGPSAADLMREELEQSFSTPVTFTEAQARNTFEHGLYASRI